MASQQNDCLLHLPALPVMRPAPPAAVFADVVKEVLREQDAHKKILIFYNTNHDHLQALQSLAEDNLVPKTDFQTVSNCGLVAFSVPQETLGLEVKHMSAVLSLQSISTMLLGEMNIPYYERRGCGVPTSPANEQCHGKSSQYVQEDHTLKRTKC